MFKQYLNELQGCLENTQILSYTRLISDWEEAFGEVVQCFRETKKNRRQLFFIGNGGSAAIASHMTADFMKNGGMRTVSLYDNALTTCMANDYGYESVFSKPLDFLGEEEDLLVTISSSGNSKNIMNAIEIAKKKNMKVITLSGFNENNRSKSMGNYNIYVPIEHYGIVESIHNLLLQQVVDTILEQDGIEI